MRNMLAIFLLSLTGVTHAFSCPAGQTQTGVTVVTRSGSNTEKCPGVGGTVFVNEQQVYDSCFVPSVSGTCCGNSSFNDVKGRQETVTINSTEGRIRYRQYYNRTLTQPGFPPQTVNDANNGWVESVPKCEVPPPHNPCEELQGGQKMMAADTVLTGDFCNPNNQCRMTFSESDRRALMYSGGNPTRVQFGTYTGQGCQMADEDAEGRECEPGQFCPEQENNEACGVLNGEEFCAPNDKPNCGTFNGQEICAGPGPEDGACQTTPGGQMVCVQSGLDPGDKPRTPPAPNTGQEGEAAQPDGAVKNPATGTTVHVYNPGTVSNSTHDDPECDPLTEECEGEPGHDGDGQCEAGEEGTPDCEDGGGGDCDPEAEEECGEGGAKFTAPGIKYEYSDADAVIAAKQAEIAAFISEVQTAMAEKLGTVPQGGSGALPCIDFSIFGRSIHECLSEFEQPLQPLRQFILLAAAFIAAVVILRP